MDGRRNRRELQPFGIRDGVIWPPALRKRALGLLSSGHYAVHLEIDDGVPIEAALGKDAVPVLVELR